MKSKINKIVAFVMTAAMLFTCGGVNAFAAQVKDCEPSISMEEITEKYHITEDEVLHLEDNLNAVKGRLQQTVVVPGEEVVIPVSDNLNLCIETEIIPSTAASTNATTYDRTITSTLSLKNVVGATIITLRSVGVFRTNGTTSKPIDAYGTYDAWVWNITNNSSSLGASAYNARVRNSFSGELNIGIDPVSMTIQSFSYTCTIYCNAVGTYSSSWS